MDVFMSVSNLIDFNRNLSKQSQNFCSKSNPSNLLSRLVIGVIIKDITLIYPIAIHIIIGLGKIAICTTKIVYSIPARLWGATPSYDIGKEGFAHLSFSGYYFADIFISLTNIIHAYPKDKMEKIENCFSHFFQTSNKKARYQEELYNRDLLFQKHPQYFVKHAPKFAEKKAKIFTESRPELFKKLYTEYVENNKGQKKIQQKATVYARNCMRIYAPIYLRFAKKYAEKEAQAQALLYAKTYVQAHSKASKRQPKTQSKEKTATQADIYAKHFTKLFFLEYQLCLKNTPETAEKQALELTEKILNIYDKACIFSDKISEETAQKIQAALFADVLCKISTRTKNTIDLERYFNLYIQKYVECCLKNGLTKNTKTIAARYAKRCTQPKDVKGQSNSIKVWVKSK